MEENKQVKIVYGVQKLQQCLENMVLDILEKEDAKADTETKSHNRK